MQPVEGTLHDGEGCGSAREIRQSCRNTALAHKNARIHVRVRTVVYCSDYAIVNMADFSAARMKIKLKC